MAWYETFFDEHYLKEYAEQITPERTEKEVDFIRNTLNLLQVERSEIPCNGSARVLDLCCGHGRHTVELAAAGYSMVGQDLSTIFLDLAKTTAAERNLQIQFIHSDMRHIPFEGEFDAVINMFTAFGYFDDDTEDEKVLNAVAKALKPEGRFLIDFINALRILRNFRLQEWQELSEGRFVLTQRRYDVLTGRNEDYRVYIAPDGRNREVRLTVRMYLYPELAKMLNRAGLVPVQVFGDYDGSQYEWDSRRMIILAEKREQ
ncbi:class I SAM-dependent methyltransferase [Candidatus Poribacteria bacterium]|nr:class I SAM-dependent methyltransferase [Candidatus Poribacteria bacterium]